MTSNSSECYSSSLLSNKTALITGAGKGIGKACVEAFIHAGARVIAVARTASDLDELSARFGDRLIPWVMDATSDEFLEQIAQHPQIDILINNLGTNKPQSLLDLTDEALDTMLDLNLRTLFRVTRSVVRSMQHRNIGGSIVNIGSQMGHIGSPNRSVYCATKHGVEGLTKALGVELAPLGIRVNSIAPTFIETPMTAPMLNDPDFNQFVLDRIPLGRVGQVEEVANAAVFLASRASSLTTGSCLKVDGGWTAQ